LLAFLKSKKRLSPAQRPTRLGRVFFFGLVLVSGCARREPRATRSPPSSVSTSRGADPAGAPRVTSVLIHPSATEVCRNALDDNQNQLIDEGCNEPLGDVFVALAWTDPSAKLDLIVTDPGGDLAPVGRATPLGLVRTRDCPGQDRECQGVNYETALVEGEEPLKGTFLVRVRFESIEPRGASVRAQLGIRTPGRVSHYSLTFLRPGTEFVIAVPVRTGS
jgi:hypothetical protein